MTRLAVKIGYLGNEFTGSQIQPNFKTVEGQILSDLNNICHKSPEELDLKLASRTDKGVNSLGNVAAFNTDFEDLDILLTALNAVSKGIFYRSYAIVNKAFNVRFADARQYQYILPCDDIDLHKAQDCAGLFVGEHNFERFCRSEGKPTTLTIDSITIKKCDNTLIIEYSARYYLWNMIRRMTAAISAVGKGYRELSEVQDALDGKDMTFGLTRPDALTLTDIIYKDVKFIIPEKNLFGNRIKEELFCNNLRSSFFKSL